MLLAIDIGNTNISIGVFDGHTLVCTVRLSADTRRLADEYGETTANILSHKGIKPEQISGSSICSVVPPLTSTFEEVCREYFKVDPFTVSTGVKTGVRILYDNPRDVGTDRVVDAAAAYRMYGGPTIIVDFGTGTVFDAISEEGHYLGGAIAPGIELAAEALHKSTSQLRRVDILPPKQAIGKNTAESLKSGLFLGYVSLVEGMVNRFKDELGPKAKVIATGGLSSIISRETRIFDAINPNLTLIGLKMVFDMNKDITESPYNDSSTSK